MIAFVAARPGGFDPEDPRRIHDGAPDRPRTRADSRQHDVRGRRLRFEIVEAEGMGALLRQQEDVVHDRGSD
ncbi:hypothetical protein [Burkholderia oklahomensis]|uniref:hypothetical protein n=1 Tax=Burkholderia oklahomensis TaxID=342113 RepID=UPI001E2C7C12|nr:hypothetical protein [Burkholderia oklahomensis]